NYSLYDHSMNIYASEKFAMENELREAINAGDIKLYYQPIINLKTHRLLAVEALARWQHPTKGLLLPGDFIPLAEETGLISQLTDHVLKSACRQQQEWRAKALGRFRMAINLSAHKFGESNFLAQ